MQKILLIDDSPEQHVLTKSLLGHRFEILKAMNASEGKTILQKQTVDLVLLDVTLPDGDGFRIFSELKSIPGMRDVPIVFLTGKKAVQDRVVGFSLGADDYIVKPIEPLEFRARIEAKLEAIRTRKNIDEMIEKGRIRIDRKKFSAEIMNEDRSTKTLDLTPHEFKILVCFMLNEESVLSRNELMDQVWGRTVNVLDRTVDRHISALRKKLGSNSGVEIESVHGMGYRLVVSSRIERAA